MTETTVSASHFRVHFKESANSVARGGQAYTVARHGLELATLVSLEDAYYSIMERTGKFPEQRPFGPSG